MQRLRHRSWLGFLYGQKRKAEGELIDEIPAQRLRVRFANELARIGFATELLLDDWEGELALAQKASEKAGIRIPTSYKEAVNDPVYSAKWKEAIRRELTTLVAFGTWKLIPRKDVQGTVSSNRGVFDLKIGADGRIEPTSPP